MIFKDKISVDDMGIIVNYDEVDEDDYATYEPAELQTNGLINDIRGEINGICR